MILYVFRDLRRRRMAQSGSSFLVVLVIIALATILFATVLSYSATANRATTAYTSLRNARYSASNAIDSAINWARENPKVGRDASLSATAVDCVRKVATDAGSIKVSCEPDAGSKSGTPTDVGLSPPESLLLLSDRNVNTPNTPGQSGPYNTSTCKGWWDSVSGWFSNGTDPNTGVPEYSALFADRINLGTLNATCSPTGRAKTNFVVNGDMVAAGRIDVESSGSITVQGKGSDGTAAKIFATSCTANITCNTLGTRADGSPRGSDPARPSTPGVNPTDIKPAYESIPFDQSGALRSEYSTTCATGKRCFPERTTAYLWSPGSPSPGVGVPAGLTATGGCNGAAATVVFLPGWYKKSEVLNRYTKSTASNCAGTTFWFAPDPGPDNVLLTADDVSGAYYFDFRDATGASGCNDFATNAARWCIGGSSSQNARIVAGTPGNWSPLGTAPINAASGTDTRSRVQVSVGTAATVDKDLSQTWTNGDNASTIDGNYATYAPCSFIFTCPSVDRAIRLRDFTPDVTNGPIDDPGYTNGRIYLTVAYGLVNGSSVSDPKVQIAAVSTESGPRDCGTYTIPKIAYSGTGVLPAPYTFTSSQAKDLADRCSSIDLINGLEVKLIVTGNEFNTSPIPKVVLDGVKISYDSFQGASFPVDTATNSATAKSDCDPNGVGAQFIFGGASHVYVADGSVEVCGGRFPTNPEDHQVIGVYGMPTVQSIKPTAVVSDGGDDGDGGNDVTVLNPSNALSINAAGGKNDQASTYATIKYKACAAFCGGDYAEGRAKLTMAQYSAPTGYTVSKISARVSYNPKNQGCATGLWGCPGANAQLRPPRCGNIDMPKNPDDGNLQFANHGTLVLYDTTATTNPDCLRPSELAAAGGATLGYAARAKCSVYVCRAGGGYYNDELDGIELDITLVPSDSTSPRLIPQQGCITAYPNYGAGEGTPDCAVIRADTRAPGDTWGWAWATKEGQWTGRISVKGMIYTPSAAVEIDDSDIAYPVASRGAIIRHLRASGWKARKSGTTVYSGPSFGTSVDKTPTPREMTFTACTQTAARQATDAHCDASSGDRLLARAAVRFEIDATAGLADENRSRVPRVLWWSSDL